MPTADNGGFSVIAVVVVLVLLALGGGLYLYVSNNTVSDTTTKNSLPSTTTKKTSTNLSQEILTVLGKKTNLIESLASDPKLIEQVRSSGLKDSNLSQEQIISLDEKWQASTQTDAFITSFLTNQTALILTKFQEDHPEFPEIFVTNQVGLNVGQTNKTSDYLQADEAWWQKAFADKKGLVSHGEIEFDDSSKSESISLYVPVMINDEAIGVIKAVLSLSGIKREL